MQARRIPLRKCTGCGEMKPKKELVRVVKSPEGEISLDLIRKEAGPGCLCLPQPDLFTNRPEDETVGEGILLPDPLPGV